MDSESLQSEVGQNLTQACEHLLVVLAKADGDANTILATIVTRSIAHQDATVAHAADEGFALFAEVEEYKIRATWPETKTPGRELALELAATVNRLGNVSTDKLLIGKSVREA